MLYEPYHGFENSGSGFQPRFVRCFFKPHRSAFGGPLNAIYNFETASSHVNPPDASIDTSSIEALFGYSCLVEQSASARRYAFAFSLYRARGKIDGFAAGAAVVRLFEFI